MKVDTYTSVPCVVDWNEDGKKDLRVGCFYDGNVYFFNNSGSDISSQAVKAARTNFLCLPDGNRINLTVMDFHRLENLKVLCKKV